MWVVNVNSICGVLINILDLEIVVVLVDIIDNVCGLIEELKFGCWFVFVVVLEV